MTTDYESDIVADRTFLVQAIRSLPNAEPSA